MPDAECPRCTYLFEVPDSGPNAAYVAALEAIEEKARKLHKARLTLAPNDKWTDAVNNLVYAILALDHLKAEQGQKGVTHATGL